GEKGRTGVTPAVRHCTSSDGLSLHALDWAPAPYAPRRIDVLCLAGLTRHARDFDDVAARLAARGHRVFCPDLRGRGRSDYARDPATYSPPQYFDDLRAQCVAARLDAFAVVGTSFGGLLAMALASVMAGPVRGIAMNDIGPEVATEGARRILDYISVDRPRPRRSGQRTRWPREASRAATSSKSRAWRVNPARQRTSIRRGA
ncbi:MAG: alpha/beta fold hydrolase, partial [Tagaea sp.]